MNFNLKKSAIYPAVRFDPFFRLINVFKKIFLVLFVLVFSLFILGFLSEKVSLNTSKLLLGLSMVSFCSFLLGWLCQSFFNLKLKEPKLKASISIVSDNLEEYNLADFLSFETARAINKSDSKTTSTNLLYFLLKDNSRLNFVFSRACLDLKEFQKHLEKYLSVVDIGLEDILLQALKIAQEKEHSRIEIGDVLTALAKQDPLFKEVLVKADLRVDDIENLTWWLENLENRIKARKRFWDYENLMKRGSLAKSWTAGYTVTLDKYSKDLTEALREKDLEFVGHKDEIKIIERVLSRIEMNNVLMVGEPGTGKKSIIYDLVKRSIAGQSLESVNYKRVVELNMPSLLAEIQNPEEVESVLDNIFKEAASAGNVILVISEFHNYIGQEARPGVVDISGIIVPYLRLPQFQLIAITTYNGLHRHIEKNSSILSLFEKVEVSEISKRETLMLLENLSLFLEKRYKKLISYPALREIVSLTENYMPLLFFPEKAIEILDEVVIYVSSSTKDKIVLPKHVSKVITEKTEIPVGRVEVEEKNLLLNLEQLIHKRIINQDQAVIEVSTALRRARSEISVRRGPMGAFLFLGPTGVGKTETSKALAEIYFRSEKNMIRLDMSEFQDISDIKRLIGSLNEPGLLTTPVRENPFSLVLFDEFEKAHPNILNLFLQVLDEGHLTDGSGKRVSFKKTIIIATSNAGYKVILDALRENLQWSKVKQKLLDYLFEERIYRPELINRFDAFVVFQPLSKSNLLDIAGLMLNKLKKNLEEKGVELIITESLKDKIVALGYSPVFGAREIRRVIQDKIENVLAMALLSDKLKKGDRAEINPEEFKLIIN